MTVTLRRMAVGDIDAVLAIQSEYYSGKLVEPGAVIRNRLAMFPDTAWVAQDADGVCAYLAGCRTILGTVIVLGEDFPQQSAPTSLYLHDMAVSRRVAGRGIGAGLVALAWQQARDDGLASSSLVAIPSAQTYWLQKGYREMPPATPQHLASLATYGAQARFMARIFP